MFVFKFGGLITYLSPIAWGVLDASGLTNAGISSEEKAANLGFKVATST